MPSALTSANHSYKDLRPKSTSFTNIDSEYRLSTMDNVTAAIQMSNKVSYEIQKNNEHIAQLTLPRISYRLGESVIAVLDFSKSNVACHHVSVFLESSESVDAIYSIKTKQQVVSHTRVCHGEAHRNTLNSVRIAISLPIPPNATSDFQTTAGNLSHSVSLQWALRVEFITGDGSSLLKTVSDAGGFTVQTAVHNVTTEPFDCCIPLKVFGAMRSLTPMNRMLIFDV